MPHITIQMYPGRDDAKKKRLAGALYGRVYAFLHYLVFNLCGVLCLCGFLRVALLLAPLLALCLSCHIYHSFR